MPNVLAASTSDGQSILDDEKGVSLTKISPNVWMHTSIGIVDGEKIPANGLILATSQGLVMIDTPWDDDLTEQLFTLVKKQFPHKKVTDAIVTHSHDDRIGGIKTLYNKGVNVHSTELTADFAQQRGFERPLGDLKKVANLKFGHLKIQTFYPGKGHTEDNIVVWLPQEHILFGGCLIKSLETAEIVQTPGSFVNEWPKSVQKVMKKYNQIEQVIPGHGNPGNEQLLDHTIDLLQ
ncbi:subclass B1 metallo-beta-lactamase [Bacillus sp. 1P06AnD]|uniref:subclass B1 metallo-beta-lactamase n=1 Tax=Bacillus sp. 1P06AnD TaxID=3132208 RepID=UPI0039A351EB